MVKVNSADISKLKERVKQILLSQSQPTITVLSSLLAVQDDLGYIPMQAIEEVAALCNVTVNDVWGVADYYTNFRVGRPPKSKLSVQVCWGPTCHIKGAQRILQAIKDEFKIGADEDEGEFELKYNTCLGACAHAPVIAFKHDLVGRIEPREAVERIKSKLESDEA